AVDSRKKVMAHLAGNRIVEMVKEDLKLSRILTRQAIENAIIINSAVGGSTNMMIHLTAIAGRIGVDLNIEDFDKIGSDIPLLVSLMPSRKYLMEDFFYAGGVPAGLHEMRSYLHTDALTINGKTIAENIKDIPGCYNREVIAPIDTPIKNNAGIVVLKGNLC